MALAEAASMKTSLALFAVAACASTAAPPRQSATSRGLHADEHIDAARDHTRRADELARWPEARRNDVGRFDDPNSGIWYRSFDHASEQQRLVDAHRAAAAQLHVEYDEACANIAAELARVSPLQRYGKGGMPTSEGVVVFLGVDAGPPDRLLAELRCHRAWMMLSEAGMEHCPLDLPGIHIVLHGDATGISVDIRIDNARLVPELQRRAAHDLEVAQKRSAF
jgi:hypothetical protein